MCPRHWEERLLLRRKRHCSIYSWCYGPSNPNSCSTQCHAVQALPRLSLAHLKRRDTLGVEKAASGEHKRRYHGYCYNLRLRPRTVAGTGLGVFPVPSSEHLNTKCEITSYNLPDEALWEVFVKEQAPIGACTSPGPRSPSLHCN